VAIYAKSTVANPRKIKTSAVERMPRVIITSNNENDLLDFDITRCLPDNQGNLIFIPIFEFNRSHIHGTVRIKTDSFGIRDDSHCLRSLICPS
jgi:hypothetical protein